MGVAGKQLVLACTPFARSRCNPAWNVLHQLVSKTEMLFGLNGFPRSLRTPRAANSVDMARKLNLPPLGFLRASAFASLTTSGRVSARLLRPSTFAGRDALAPARRC
jgi:hypothetical protein